MNQERIVQKLEDNDVLFGRGNGIAFFSGNVNFRRIAGNYRDAYANLEKGKKKALASEILEEMAKLDPPSRFLEPCHNGFVQVPEDRVIEKICQILREKKFQDPKPEDEKRIIRGKSDSPKSPAVSPSNRRGSKKAKLAKSTVRTENKKKPRGRSSTKRRKNHGDAMEISLEKTAAIDPAIVSPDASKNSGYASKLLQDEMDSIASSSQAKKEEELDHESTPFPLIPRTLFSEETEERDAAFGLSRSLLPRLDMTYPEEDDDYYLAEALDDGQFEPFPDHLNYHFDPFADGCHEHIVHDVPLSLTAFFASYSGRSRLSRSSGGDSPTTVLEMQDGSFPMLQ